MCVCGSPTRAILRHSHGRLPRLEEKSHVRKVEAGESRGQAPVPWGGRDDGSEPEMCQRPDEHLEGREVYVIMWGSTLLGCVTAMLGKREQPAPCPLPPGLSVESLGSTDQTAQHPHSWPGQLPTATESERTRVISLQDQWARTRVRAAVTPGLLLCPLSREV